MSLVKLPGGILVFRHAIPETMNQYTAATAADTSPEASRRWFHLVMTQIIIRMNIIQPTVSDRM